MQLSLFEYRLLLVQKNLDRSKLKEVKLSEVEVVRKIFDP